MIVCVCWSIVSIWSWVYCVFSWGYCVFVGYGRSVWSRRLGCLSIVLRPVLSLDFCCGDVWDDCDFVLGEADFYLVD